MHGFDSQGNSSVQPAVGAAGRLLTLAAILALLVAAISFQLAFATRYQAGVLNSDSLLTYAWLRDAVRGETGFFWMGPPNPFFFPDALLYLPMLLVAHDVGHQFLLYSIAYGLLLIAALATVLHRLAGNWQQAFFHAALSVAVLALFPDLLPIHRQQIPTANCHGGALLAGVVYLGLVLRMVDGPLQNWKWRAFFIAFTAFATASNFIFPTQFVLPVLTCALLLALARMIDRRRVFQLLLDTCAAAALAAGLRWAVSESGLFWFAQAPLDLSVERVVASLRVLSNEWAPLMARELGVGGGLLTVLWLVLSGVVAWRWFRVRSRPESTRIVVPFLVLAINAAMLASIVSPVVTAVWAQGVSIRYAWPLPLLGLLFLVPLSLVVLGRPISAAPRWVVAAGLAVSVVVITRSLPEVKPTALTYPREAVGARLVELKRAGQIRAGLGEFWAARYLTVMTDHEVLINPITADTSPEPWLANSYAFLGAPPSAPPQYDFVVVDRLDSAAVRGAFGPPSRIERIGAYEIHFFGREIGEDLALRVCRRMLESGGQCPLLDSGFEVLPIMNVGDAGWRDGAAGIVGTERVGPLAFGPYVRLPPGRYQVTWRVSGPAKEAQRRFLVYSRWGKNIVQDVRVSASDGVVDATAAFTVRWQDRNDLWEFPVVQEQPAQTVLNAVTLRRLQ